MGVLALYNSLLNTGTKYPFYCLVNDNICTDTNRILETAGVKTIRVANIKNPVNTNKYDRKFYNYNKLHIFNLIQFRKIVYVDADMIAFRNIDELFERPHMSAVNAGGEVFRDWIDLNSGIMVVEPDAAVFEDMMGKLGKLPVRDVGDQAFLHQYYKGWVRNRDLHLSHVYNIMSCQLSSHVKLGYIMPKSIFPAAEEVTAGGKKFIAIIHYISQTKPWFEMERINEAPLMAGNHQLAAEKMWIDELRDFFRHHGDKLSEDDKQFIVNSGSKPRC